MTDDLSKLETEMFAAAFRFQKALADNLTNEINELKTILNEKDEIIQAYADGSFVTGKRVDELKAINQKLESRITELGKEVATRTLMMITVQKDLEAERKYIQQLEKELEGMTVREVVVYGPARDS